MKRFLKSTGLFIICCMVGYPIFIVLWGLTGSHLFYSNLHYAIDMPGYMYTRIQELKQKDKVDILIVGSSHAYRGIDTRLFTPLNLSAFNLGSSSQSPLQTKLLLKRYLDKVKPQLVIYEVSPYFFSVDGIESALNIIATDTNDKYSWEMAYTINNIKVYNTLLYGCFRDAFHLDDSFRDSFTEEEGRYIPGGFVEKNSQSFNAEILSEDIPEFEEKQWKAFNETIRLLKERNVNYILISAPVTHSHYRTYSNQIAFEKRLRSFGVYYNFNEILSLDEATCFYDPEHLNQQGAEIFTHSLIHTIIESPFYLEGVKGVK